MAKIFGASNSETLTGTAFPDQILGRCGDDYLYGLEGNDQLDGGAGTDLLYLDLSAQGAGVVLVDCFRLRPDLSAGSVRVTFARAARGATRRAARSWK